VKAGTLFSGIGAPECAAPNIDWRWCAEIDPFASAVHAARFPGVVNLGDVEKIDADTVEPVDLIVFGSPCQSFSVAGKRLGLDDPRGNLALVGLRLIGRIRPRWVVWENVPGVLSSDGGRDFGAFLGLLGELGYGFAYRILDAQHFGIPQRRRRVFVVGCLGDWRGPAAVLFEPESLRGDPAPRREAGERIARPIASCAPGGSGYRADADTADNLIAFSAKDHGGDAGDTAPTLRAGMHHGSHANAGVMPAIAHSLRADGFDASEDGTGCGTPIIPILEVGKGSSSRGEGPNGAGFGKDGDPMFTLQRGAQHAVATPLVTAFDPRQIHHPANHSNPKAGDPCHPLRGVANAEPAIMTVSETVRTHPRPGSNTVGTLTLAIRGRGDSHDLEYRDDGTANAILTPNGGRAGIGVGAVAAYGIRSDASRAGEALTPSPDAEGRIRKRDAGFNVYEERAPTLDGGVPHSVGAAMSVRRLTPKECSRLQGFPDDWCDIAYRGKPAADGPRYRALGNSMAVPVIGWILRRVQLVDGAAP